MDVDVKAMVEKVIDKAKSDPKFREELQKDPEKAVESVIGIDIPDGSLDKVLEGLKDGDSLEKLGKVSGILNMFKK
ncbi:MAG: hypothetical protein K6G12_04045 [Lachnospiraceae bacterium]|nr:hypothetical protein [Lachnospiraceae bacterium]